MDVSEVISDICQKVAAGNMDQAKQLANKELSIDESRHDYDQRRVRNKQRFCALYELRALTPEERLPKEERAKMPKDSTERQIQVFLRDGCIDRYTGQRLLFPGVIYLLGSVGYKNAYTGPLREVLPWVKNWPRDDNPEKGKPRAHSIIYDIECTWDHLHPVAAGGDYPLNNLYTTSMWNQAVKGDQLMLNPINPRFPEGDLQQWDGLLGWALAYIDENRPVLSKSFQDYFVVSRSVRGKMIN